MLFSRVVGVTPLVLFLSACTAAERPLAPEIAAATSKGQSAGVVVKVSGAGEIDLSAVQPVPAADFQFQFVAHRRADGTVTGHFRHSRMAAAGRVEFAGTVTCVTVDPAFPGRARIAGVITENNSTHPGFLTANHEVGDDAWFRVLDGGDGDAAIDRSTTLGFKPTLVNTSAEYCALPFDGLPMWNPASLFPVGRGTIGVRAD